MPERPTSEERGWLLARLADLAAAAGYERLVAGPLMADGEARGGAEATLRGLLVHAGLGELDLALDDRRAAGAPAERFTEIDYAGHGGGVVRFELRALGEEDVVGAMSIEVGKAFLDVRGARGVSGPHLGAVAAVYLGLGVPAANAAVGSLSESTLSYLVAVQRTVRGRDEAPYRGLRGADFEPWKDALAASRGELLGGLRLPPERDWPRAQKSAPVPRVAAAAPSSSAVDGVARPHHFPLPLRLGLLGLAVAAVVALGIFLGGCDEGTDVGGSCEELVARWQTAVYQASVEPCGGDGDCVAVGEIAACECTLSGADAVPRDSYDDQGGTDLFIEIARRGCRDDCQPSTPSIVARCVANRCQLDYEGACATGRRP